MAKGFRPVDRDQQFLLPPDMRQWLPAGHPVWVLIDVVRLLDTSGFHARCRTGGAGRSGYDPDMLLTLLFYAYARGVRSSRKIERLCWEDVACRVICAQDAPDHVTIWRFADAAPDLVQDLFTEVLTLCAKAGMLRLETITLDGMKIGANASSRAHRTETQIREELAGIAADAVAEHRSTDTAENALFGDRRGDEVPEQLADPRSRLPRLRRALTELETDRITGQAERDAKTAAYLARQDAGPVPGAPPADAQVQAARRRLDRAITVQQTKLEDWDRRNTEAITTTGAPLPRNRRPKPVEAHATVIRARAVLARAETAQAERDRRTAEQPDPVRNTTDPDSRFMPTRSGFITGYNTQNVITEDLYILATELTQDPNDVQHAIPMMTAAEHAADLITTTKTTHAGTTDTPCTRTSQDPDQDPDQDTGDRPRPVCAPHPTGIGIAVMDAGYLSEDNLTATGPDRLIATGKHRDIEKAATNPDQAEPDQPGPIEQMTRRLRTPEGLTTYRKRSHIAETPHGHIKHNMGIRTLTRRGLHRATAEWKLICTTYNLNRLLRTLQQTGNPLPTTT